MPFDRLLFYSFVLTQTCDHLAVSVKPAPHAIKKEVASQDESHAKAAEDANVSSHKDLQQMAEMRGNLDSEQGGAGLLLLMQPINCDDQQGVHGPEYGWQMPGIDEGKVEVKGGIMKEKSEVSFPE